MSKKNNKAEDREKMAPEGQEVPVEESDLLDETVAKDSGSESAEETAEDSSAEEPELTPEELLARERDEFKEKWLRVVAELDNVRKRSARQLVDGRRFAQADILRSFLEVHDNFERALQSMKDAEDNGGNKGVREGVELIFQNFRRVLKDQGVEPIEALEQEFDPTFHEAVGQFEREGVEAGQVIEVVQQGFKMGDMVLRPSRVIISS